MLDLSFLTEEEQEAIMKVLQRDAELKRTEEERVRHLPEKIKDDVQLKNMSGQWFYEAKSKRHRDKIHGADIVRASMRRKPASRAEMSQNKPSKAKNSWVSNVNKEVFVPPELHGIEEHQEEQLKSNSSLKTPVSLLAKPQDMHMKTAVSPAKQRRNPFNSTASGDNFNSEESENAAATLLHLSKKEVLSLSEESQPNPNLQNDEPEKHTKPPVEATDESQKGLIKHPVPKARKLIHKATDPVSRREEVVPKPAKWTENINGAGTPPRGILKRSSSSSSTDSEVRVSQMLDVQKKNGLPTATIFEGEAEQNSLTEEAEDATQSSLEKLKQVRFSCSIGKGEPVQGPQVYHSREAGEFELLETDKIKSRENDAIGSDSLENKQVSAVKPFGTDSSGLQIRPTDGLQGDTWTSGPCDTNRSGFLANETLQGKAVTPKQLGTSQKTSGNILPDSNNGLHDDETHEKNELSGDESHESKSNQTLSSGSKSHRNFTDKHQLSAKTEIHGVSNTSSKSLQQGKPNLVEEQDAKTTFKHDKNADELMQVADESVSKVLDWFKRSLGTEDRKHLSARSQDREPQEEVDISSKTAVCPAEHSGPSMDRKTEVTKKLTFGKIKQQSNISSMFISEDTQMIERVKPKKRKENEEQNDRSLTEIDCTRVQEVEHGQEIKQQNQKSNLLEHQEHKLTAQKYQSEKSIQEKRRIKEIRIFWEKDKSVPSCKEREVGITANAPGGGALEGLGDTEKIKSTAVYLPSGSGDQSKYTLRSYGLSCTSQASKNEHQNSSELGPGHAAEKVERTIPSNGEVPEYTELQEASNWQPRIGATLCFPESKDEKETLKQKAAAHYQQRPNFQVLSLKEKMNEKSKNQILDPSQFQSLRNFWDTGVKLQNNIDREAVSLSNNANLITCEVKSKEDKGNNKLSKQELIQRPQTPEREKTQKLDPVVHELPLRSPTLNVTGAENTDTIQLDRKPVISKPQEKMGLSQQEVKDCTEKNTGSAKEHHVSLQLLQSPGDKDASKETAEGEWLCLSAEKVENKTTPLDVSLSEEEVAETVDKVVLPTAELDVFKLGLSKLEKEVSETSSSLNLKENILKETTFHSNQCMVFERTVEQRHDTSVDQKEEIRRGVEKMNVPSTDEHANKGLGKLFGEFESFYLQHQAADKDDTLEGSWRPQSGLQNLLRETFTSQPSEYRMVRIKKSDDINSISQTNCTVESMCQEDIGQPEEVSETIERSVAPSKVSDLSSVLEKLVKEASETPPPKPKRAHITVPRTTEVEFESRTYQHDRELSQEIPETIEKSVAPSKASALNSCLEKLIKEASETPSPKPKHADSMIWRPAKVEASSTAYEHGGELLQETDETIEKSVAPSKVSGLSSALEKLVKEASETPLPKPKCAHSTVPRAAEAEFKSRIYQCDGALPQEISETIEKSVAPSKVNDLSSALEKLVKEASETPPPTTKCAQNMVQRTAEVEFENRTNQHDEELPQEINETVEKYIAPSRISDLSSVLEKLAKEGSKTPPPKTKYANNTAQRAAEVDFKNRTHQRDGELLQINETIEKSVAPSKASDLSSALEKLVKKASETPPPKPKHADSTVQRTAEMEVKSTTYEYDGELPQEIKKNIGKSIVPHKVSGLSSALEELMKGSLETPPPTSKHADNTVQRTAEMELKSRTYQHDGMLLQEIRETIEKSVVSKAEHKVFDINLQKLLKEVSVAPASVEENTDRKPQGKMQASQSMHAPHQHKRVPLQEIEETIEKTSVSSIAKLSKFSSSLEALLQEASETSSPEQDINASVHNLAVSEIKASDLPKRNGAINKIDKRNLTPTDLLSLEGETNMTEINRFETDEKGRRGESTSLDASENHSEFKALLKFRKTSTPIKDESNSIHPEDQLCLISQHENNDEEERDGSNSGSKFSDENSKSLSGTGSSTRSEEELNPVLMALKRSADRKMPSKSLEDIPSATSNKGKLNNPKEELALSAEDVSTVPSQPDKLFTNPDKLKGLCKSVPSFLQEESDDRETDTASESSYSLGRIKKSPSSLTNLSSSSGMASLSSVSGSLMSIYSADFGNVDVKGSIQFAIDYVEQLNELHIFICQCKGLAVADVKRQRSDPYVKTYLLPEKYKLGKRKTSVKKKTFNPVYNEILRYKIEKDLLKNQSLNISVWHNDTFGRNSFLGEVELDLGTWDWNNKSNKQINWFPLQPRTSMMALTLENRGEMKLALQYVPHPVGGKKTISTGEVHIWVKECHDLPLLRGNRLNSFIKCTILPDTSRKSRQKTRTVSKTANPVFNHTMVYDGFRPEDLKEACVELTVWDHNKLANHFLGGLRIGLGTGKSYGTTVDWMDSTSDETALWEKMMKSPNRWVEDTLPLRMLMVAKLTK